METKLTKAEKWLRDIAAREAQKWYAMQCQDIHGQFYVYYTAGDVVVAEDAPDETYRLATPQRLSPVQTQNEVKHFIYNALRRCPCLPLDL